MTRPIFASSSINGFLVCNLPAVSTISTSASRCLAACTASKTTEAGSACSPPRISSAPARSHQIASWSSAAARKVSPAATTTRFPADWKRLANFPIVVVFPAPFTPRTKIVYGMFRGNAVERRVLAEQVQNLFSENCLQFGGIA